MHLKSRTGILWKKGTRIRYCGTNGESAGSEDRKASSKRPLSTSLYGAALVKAALIELKMSKGERAIEQPAVISSWKLQYNPKTFLTGCSLDSGWIKSGMSIHMYICPCVHMTERGVHISLKCTFQQHFVVCRQSLWQNRPPAQHMPGLSEKNIPQGCAFLPAHQKNFHVCSLGVASEHLWTLWFHTGRKEGKWWMSKGIIAMWGSAPCWYLEGQLRRDPFQLHGWKDFQRS